MAEDAIAILKNRCRNTEDMLPDAEDNSMKLQQLIDATTEHNTQERNRIIELWNELKEDPSKKMYAGFELKATMKYGFEIKCGIISHSSAELAMWKCCFYAAFAKLNINDGSIKTNKKSVAVRISANQLKTVLCYLRPLAGRTNWTSGEIKGKRMRRLYTNFTCDYEESESHENALEKLIDDVLKHQRYEGTKLLSHWEILKNNEHKFLKSRLISIEKDELYYGEDEDEESETQGRTCLSVDLSNQSNEFIIWKNCLDTVIATLDIAHSLVACEDRITVSMNTDNWKDVFAYLKPLVPKMLVDVSFCEASAEIIRMSSEFFEPESVVEFLTFETPNPDFDAWLDFVRKTRPARVTHYVGVTRPEGDDVTGYLLPLADLVEAIIMVNFLPNRLSVIREILRRRKCKYLRVDNNKNMSLNDAEKLVQYFSRLDKHVAVELCSGEHSMRARIGEYVVEIDEHRDNGVILIEHVDIMPKYDHVL